MTHRAPLLARPVVARAHASVSLAWADSRPTLPASFAWFPCSGCVLTHFPWCGPFPTWKIVGGSFLTIGVGRFLNSGIIATHEEIGCPVSHVFGRLPENRTHLEEGPPGLVSMPGLRSDA